MPKASDLLRQGRHEEIWEMCCGYIKYDIKQFMTVQKRLLLEQIEALSKSKIGKKIFNGAVIQSVEEFREQIPLTTYASYCPELSEKMEDSLPEKPAMWVHTSGRSGEFPCKWVPMTASYIDELSTILYGIGIFSGAKKWGDFSPFIKLPKMMYTVAPRPWISGALASMLGEQTPLRYYPSLKEAEKLPFEERIRMGFDEALSGGIDYFFGLSLVLSAVGTNISQSARRVDIRPLFSRPKALMRLTKGIIKSRIAGRSMLPKDLWDIKGIITSGLDSSVYKDKIKEYWGRYPLDVYANTEGGVIATQTWDYEGMTFIPNLNFLEFIPFLLLLGSDCAASGLPGPGIRGSQKQEYLARHHCPLCHQPADADPDRHGCAALRIKNKHQKVARRRKNEFHFFNHRCGRYCAVT